MAVVVIITDQNEAAPLIRWGCHFATARHLDLAVLHPRLPPSDNSSIIREIDIDDASVSGDALTRTVCNILIGVRHQFEYGPNPHGGSEAITEAKLTFRVIDDKNIIAAVKAQLKSLKAELLILGKQRRIRGDTSELAWLKQLFTKAPCDTLLLRAGQSQGLECRRILVPAAGGPHSVVALRWSEQIAQKNNGELTALFIEPEIGDDAVDVGMARIGHILSAAGVKKTAHVAPRVVVADNVEKGITNVATADYDLLLVGASDQGLVRRILFGTLPARLLEGPDAVAIGTVRRARPMATRWREDLEEWLDLQVPQLDRPSRIDLVERLQIGAQWNFDFMALMCFSTSIAAFGLIQSSTAVVIGAMLVAPLMMPLIAVGMALVQANVPLVRDSIRSIGYGFCLALGIGILCGIFSPLKELTAEIEARAAPNLFDLAVAYISGVAAAYALSRPNLSASLPGVAIAAALVPPLATTGIALAFGEMSVARGAGMLFTTNVVAIILGAACVFYACGVRGNRRSAKRRLWVRRTVFGLLLAGFILAIPLFSVLLDRVARDDKPAFVISSEMRTDLEAIISVSCQGIVTASRILTSESPPVLALKIDAPFPPEKQVAEQLGKIASSRLGQPVRVRIITRLVSEVTVEGD